ncbi:hypothetical protein EMIHUDRAFT_351390, partial [Emiliania huxleyi CCMP1516]|uniref:Uncharacterized protein n=2 Tax=Emiliania huxleyi TaxID=2903 RepID=A0A0D3KUJ7_EMIH1
GVVARSAACGGPRLHGAGALRRHRGRVLVLAGLGHDTKGARAALAASNRPPSRRML